MSQETSNNALQDPTPEPIGTIYEPAPDRLPLVEEGEAYEPTAVREN